MIKVIALDECLADAPVLIIKADIEGSELAMLKGAASIIKTNKPKLAISMYHKPEDFFELSLYIKELVPEYKMAVRLHNIMGLELVLYCWV